MTATIFKNFVQRVEEKSLIIITKEIKDGKYQQQVQEIRNLIANGNIEAASALKKKLLAFTPSGTFLNGRKADLLTVYSGNVVLDIDNITEQQIALLFKIVVTVPHTFAAFISPSGNGVKIIVAVSSTGDHHEIAFAQVAAYYAEELQIIIDPSGKDVSRLCFMSYDPNCYRNINATPFQVIINSIVSEPIKPKEIQDDQIAQPNIDDTWNAAFNECVIRTENKSVYINGNRNNFIHLLACNCNRVGMPQGFAECYMLNTYDLEPKEIKQSIESAYKNNTQEFAKFANLATSYEHEPLTKDEQLMNMPYLPENCYSQLPSILKTGAEVLQDRREKDITITAGLAILSGCMPNVVGLYRGKVHYSNLFVFVIAPAASGKGAITHAKQLGDKYHDILVNESQKAADIFKMAMAEYKRTVQKGTINLKDLQPPKEPPFKVLFIPANNSSARIIQHLKEGDEQGIFCETEADTMGNVLKQDWGSYSDLLRKAYHHETVSYSRKTNKEWIELKSPRLSVVLAGTPGQVEGLIKSAEDGLFSRFIFYIFKSETKWVNASATINNVNLSQHYSNISEMVLLFVQFLQTHKTINFHLSQPQWDALNNYGETCLNYLSTFVSEDMASTSKRLGLILFRIAMIITALRYFDNAESTIDFHCTDDDFNLALQMVQVYQDHAVFMFGELPKTATLADKNIGKLYNLLPPSFKRKVAIQIADQQLNIKSRTADTYLKKLMACKWLHQPIYGTFEKFK